jgi:long-chain acyl-CoA synthetase
MRVMSTHAPASVAAVAPASGSGDTLGRMLLEARDRGDAVPLRRRVGRVFVRRGPPDGDRARARPHRVAPAAGDRIAILGGTCPGWTAADSASLAAGTTVVPIYQTNSPEECRHVLAHSGAQAVISEDTARLAKLEAIRADCPDLEHVLSFADFAVLRERGAAETLEDALPERLADVRAGDVATIVYTSGPPKGCMLTPANCRLVQRERGGQPALGRLAAVS